MKKKLNRRNFIKSTMLLLATTLLSFKINIFKNKIVKLKNVTWYF